MSEEEPNEKSQHLTALELSTIIIRMHEAAKDSRDAATIAQATELIMINWHNQSTRRKNTNSFTPSALRNTSEIKSRTPSSTAKLLRFEEFTETAEEEDQDEQEKKAQWKKFWK
jgi:hypothetical protein